jgi:hypothetical protein
VIVEHRGEVFAGNLASGNDILAGFLPFQSDKNQQPIDFGIAIGAGSNIRMLPFLTAAPVRVGEPISLSAVVQEAGLPLLGCNVTVTVVSPSGKTWNISLLDDGGHEDGEQNDGEYGQRFLRAAEAGSYELTFRVAGMSLDGEPFVRESARSVYVEGRTVIAPGRGRPGEPDACCEGLVRLLAKQDSRKPFSLKNLLKSLLPWRLRPRRS